MHATAVGPTEPAVAQSARRLSREARVRPELASLYPWLRPGEWASAATVADRVLAARLLRGSATAVRGRVLPDTHFEFRGGRSEGGERTGVRLLLGPVGRGVTE